jgi:fluoroacetyl-CoA thioesterase
MLAPGLVGEVRRMVDGSLLASALGSGNLDVFATPALVALMEQAACAAVDAHLAPGQTSVGVRIDVAHLAATPPGVEVRARAELVEVDGRRLVFQIEAFDNRDRIGEGRHERALVDPERLLARANAKRDSAA